MLREDVEQYTNLTGEDGWHVPIMKVGAYLDGYNKGFEVLDKLRAEIALLSHDYPMGHDYQIAITRCIAVIDKYKAESEDQE